MMIGIYLTDENRVYTGPSTVSPTSPIPDGASFTPPPATTGTQVAQWSAGGWTVLGACPTPPVAVPKVVTMRQARLALLGAGLLAGVTTAINAMSSPQKEAAQIEWEYSQTVERYRGFVLILGAALGLTEAQIDSLFVTAAGL